MHVKRAKTINRKLAFAQTRGKISIRYIFHPIG